MAQIYQLLASPIEYLKGVGPQRADLLKKELNIFTFGDLLHHFSFRYIDRTSFYKINQLTPNTQYVQIIGKVMEKNVVGENKGKRFVAYFADDTGEMELIWFQGLRWAEKTVEIGKKYVVFGKPGIFRGEYSIVHPDITPFEAAAEKPDARLQPMYSSTEKLKSRGLHSKGIEKLVATLLSLITIHDLSENLPDSLVQRFHFLPRFEAFNQIHFPENEAVLEKTRNRLKFEELFFSQLRILQLKVGRKRASAGFVFTRLDPSFNRFYHEKLPFQLTAAQKRVVKEIRMDLISGKQMNRLLQGDVGSGKTIVSLLVMLMAIDNGFQSAMMVPTELLALQHYRNLTHLTDRLELRVVLLTASVKGKERKKILEDLQNGAIHLVIGTHALIEDKVVFKNLGLIVIDEQHRFGVEQRASLWTKNHLPPHVLVMTATPIPRTLAMTLYGDLDVSTIDELPPGRKPITTVHRFDSARLRVFGFMKEQITAGRQVYVVYPLIEESEKQDYKFLMDGYESIARAFPLPEFALSIVHGKMKSDARDLEMQRFIRNETQIMVATTVIEVGVDVPNASVMVIESAERFGLSQLHQLRGRVGRGAEHSYCILLTGDKLSAEARARMNILTQTNDGFRIAEEDLRLRGPGDLEGTQQSGLVPFHIADLARDQKILLLARTEAEALLEQDPLLQSPENVNLKTYLGAGSKKEKRWSRIS
ncbi:MAG TPA: ATP-dependent DNA helicase RecG [Chitinophagales bacterium]|nr:ATP-dependent DNA helicase RecG [Chitinophagales bacterium]